MTIQWYNGHILWKDGHIAHDPNCCCDPGPCCCCCTCYDFQFRFDYEGQTYYPTTKVCRTSDGIWTSQNSEWQLTRTGNNRYTLAGTNPPVTFQFPGPMAPPNAGPCPAPAIGWGLGESPAGGSWTILLAACHWDCDLYTDSPTVSIRVTGQAPPNDPYLQDFDATYSGNITRRTSGSPSPCAWEGTLQRTSGIGLSQMNVVLWRTECAWNLEIRNGAFSILLTTGRCSSNSHAICDTAEGPFPDATGPWFGSGGMGTVTATNITVSGGISPTPSATTMSTVSAPASATAATPVAVSVVFPRAVATFTIPDNALDICHTCGSGSCMSYCRGCGGGMIVAPCPAGRW